MTDMSNDDEKRLAQIEARTRDATEEPWEAWAGHGVVFAGPLRQNDPSGVRGGRGRVCEVDESDACDRAAGAYGSDPSDDATEAGGAATEADALFIAHARTDVPWLCERLTATLERLRAVEAAAAAVVRFRGVMLAPSIDDLRDALDGKHDSRARVRYVRRHEAMGDVTLADGAVVRWVSTSLISEVNIDGERKVVMLVHDEASIDAIAKAAMRGDPATWGIIRAQTTAGRLAYSRVIMHAFREGTTVYEPHLRTAGVLPVPPCVDDSPEND